MPASKSALIVASAAYQDPGLRQLMAPTHDAVALAGILEDPRVGGFEVKAVVDRPSFEVRAAIEDLFADRKRDDVVLLYFSGHGVKDEDGQLYFTTVDTQLNRGRLRRATAVEDHFVSDAMRRCLSRRQVLLLDCCYSGAFAKGMLAKGGVAVDTKDRFEGRGRIVLTASDAMQYSFEADEIKGEGVRSYFTRALVQGMASGDADLDRDGLFSLDELYEYVHDRMADDAPQQRPMKMGCFEGKFILAQNPLVKPIELPAELVQAIASGWVPTRLGAVAELELLRRGPNRPKAEAAQRALEALVDDDSREVARAAAAAVKPASKPPPVPAPTTPAAAPVTPAAAESTPSAPAVSAGTVVRGSGGPDETAAQVGAGRTAPAAPAQASPEMPLWTSPEVPLPASPKVPLQSGPEVPPVQASPAVPVPASPELPAPAAAAPVSSIVSKPSVPRAPEPHPSAPGPAEPLERPVLPSREPGVRKLSQAPLRRWLAAAALVAVVGAVIGAILAADRGTAAWHGTGARPAVTLPRPAAPPAQAPSRPVVKPPPLVLQIPLRPAVEMPPAAQETPPKQVTKASPSAAETSPSFHERPPQQVAKASPPAVETPPSLRERPPKRKVKPASVEVLFAPDDHDEPQSPAAEPPPPGRLHR